MLQACVVDKETASVTKSLHISHEYGEAVGPLNPYLRLSCETSEVISGSLSTYLLRVNLLLSTSTMQIVFVSLSETAL